MSLVGSPTASRMMARVSTPPAGIPAAPTLDAVAVTLHGGEKTQNYWGVPGTQRPGRRRRRGTYKMVMMEMKSSGRLLS